MKAQRYTITIVYSEADHGYIAQVPDLAFCSAFGSTPREALDEVERAMAAWLEAARVEGKPIPEPRPAKADFRVD
ncbi:type II toxin-antitoxin system HicB family antitoxin [bacterium (Candidatus Blackallbacteria) CG17_big_fil_post_rev_8_21_14_2_50_48_46]|uniref:Type II toxin-antitoxin system HicB family antitoxin n=1 Tax=bacterium (Candidatus Blackallbacteria) CG17_big_fil_post_rev_8_21_14_2_50_48_46 TaxID=2014261 RepID=A0A2M7G7Q9_9BACT|nr:MAG: HicB family protein [bacterium (Candidatus Blackallbacteria) CG18_big_fil_WC_8_21_14_2_50_49_26]PIW18079.1 MAG: type II toxin-antitoxin system HicB family antitoxin [bacterium (Candidatus Blackallbacteria) CG17_big_fil_post_rev_8_21_14_2_50_48_46]PIW51088.1 MAG: type II toxin-antitoxin system HicB family antitoxin [bacterium (Candidatus Blackallbacteria) CG13_big_fil_rev_8_21_14_2_50_49_14]